MPVVEGKNRFLLLYGSQTGQAKAIAEEIVEKADSENLQADIHCLSQVERKFYLERETCVVIVISTTGDGEPPDTALKFVRRLKKRTLTDSYLAQLNYALLGLGDSNYTNFCNCGKTLDRRLQELGAKHFYPAGWADDGVGLEVVVEPWIDGLWEALKKCLNENGRIAQAKQSIPGSMSKGVSVQRPSHQDVENSQPLVGSAVDCRCDPQLSESTCETNARNTSGQESVIRDSLEQKVVSNTQTNMASEQALVSQKREQNSPSLEQTSIGSDQTVLVPVDSSCNDSSSGLAVKATSESDSSVIEVKTASVSRSLPPLSESSLTVPALPPQYLTIEYHEDNVKLHSSPEQPLQNGCDFPSAASPVTMATVASIRTLTSPSAVKKTMAVNLDFSETGLQYEPGDSFSLVCPNNMQEVETLLNRLGLLDKADMTYKLGILTDTKKKNARVPLHVPETGSLRNLFTTCLDIREPPKKALIRALVDCTTDQSARRRLQELCSKQGANDYTVYIREPALSLLDVLHHFPSCTPQVGRLIEHLPRLLPRPYSICSSPMVNPGQVQFVFNVVEFTAAEGRTYSRKGVCTGWLEQLSTSCAGQTQTSAPEEQGLEGKMENLSITAACKVPVFTRTNQNFRLPEDVTVPLILIGPGTGVAPFIGFLDQRAAQMGGNTSGTFGDIWLFFGCRHKEGDFLFREQLEQHLANANLSRLLVAFSRDTQPDGSPRYVQDNVRRYGPELVTLLEEKKGVVFVCGDARNMAKDVNQAFVDIFSQQKGISTDEASKLVMKLRLAKQYREDVWT